MIDVREPEAVLTKLADARRRFEKGAGVPIAVRDLLVELDGAIADSGPFELEMSPGRWVRIQTRMSGLVESLNDASAQESSARARKALRQLRRVFKRGRWLRWLRAPFDDARWVPFTLLGFYFVVFVGTTWLAASHPHRHPLLLALALVVAWLSFLFVLIGAAQHATTAAGDRKLAAMHAPEERCLFASRLPSRELVIATDQRVFAVSAPRRLTRSWQLWSIPYDRITYVTPEKAANARGVRLHAGASAQRVEWRWSDFGSESNSKDRYKDEQEALVAIVDRRASILKKSSARAFGLGALVDVGDDEAARGDSAAGRR